ncbi:MAG: class I SAM-dependent methyltransferase [Methanospirillum sp.]|uniref:class I SAM-dependent methyltransferase n=1 Tax=Methanospirillum sp. TaxID=45200 RepID=UPI00236DCF0C|nr:class I SAM-dependent methyltransferase [Methanospirillum sp.]MDD1729015.1 class I SAM-dependent methyltransferase [Methanospirillum sp.]
MHTQEVTNSDIPVIQKSGNHFSNEQETRGFDMIASTIFSPIYPVIAGQILERTEKRTGVALDAGTGPAHLSVAVAKQSELKVFALDSSPTMLKIAWEHIVTEDLVQRVVPVLGDVHSIPCEDGTIDLVFSRGSWFFWEELYQAFQEIYRVLTPGGIAYIGGGFGNQKLKAEIFHKMNDKGPEFENGVKERLARNSPERIRTELDKAGIRSYDLIQDESGFWAVMKK